MCDCKCKWLLITTSFSRGSAYDGETDTHTICISKEDITYRYDNLRREGHWFKACYEITGKVLVSENVLTEGRL